MAASSVTIQQTVISGLKPTYAAANVDGNYFANDGRVRFVLINGSGSTVTVTFDTPVTVGDLAVGNRAVAVPAGETWEIGPFPPGIYNQTDGTVTVTYSAVTSVTVAAIRQ